MHKKLLATIAAVGLMAITVGCSHYYRVTDPSSGKAYYTTNVDNAGRAGAVKFKDNRTGSMVTLQSSEVSEISAEEFDAGLKPQPGAPK